jgi:hypothetical protein
MAGIVSTVLQERKQTVQKRSVVTQQRKRNPFIEKMLETENNLQKCKTAVSIRK